MGSDAKLRTSSMFPSGTSAKSKPNLYRSGVNLFTWWRISLIHRRRLAGLLGSLSGPQWLRQHISGEYGHCAEACTSVKMDYPSKYMENWKRWSFSDFSLELQTCHLRKSLPNFEPQCRTLVNISS